MIFRFKKFSVFNLDGKRIGEYETENEIANELQVNLANVFEAVKNGMILNEEFYIFENQPRHRQKSK